MCRFGNEEGRLFLGVIVCVDFCVYFYRDFYNMNNGSIVVGGQQGMEIINKKNVRRYIFIYSKFIGYLGKLKVLFFLFQVVILIKYRGMGKLDDEQFYIFLLYVMDMIDEYGCFEVQFEKVRNGFLEVL